MPVSRESIYQALIELSENITWGDSDEKTFLTPMDQRRRVKLFSDVPTTQQPALFQAEHGEQVAQTTGLPYKRTFTATWIIYQATGKDKLAIPATENNLILDAVEAAFQPLPRDIGYTQQRLTLGGLVHHCFINGEVFKDPGDIDDQGMLAIPITILVP